MIIYFTTAKEEKRTKSYRIRKTAHKARARDSYGAFLETATHNGKCCKSYFQSRLNRVPTMHALIYGGQRQRLHTILFSLIHYFCFSCTLEQLKELVLVPREFQYLMDSEEIVDYDADSKQYNDIYTAFNTTIHNNREN